MALPAAPVLLLAQTLRGRELLAPIGDARVARENRSPGLLVSWDQVHNDGVVEGHANARPLRPVLADPGASSKGYGRATIQRKQSGAWLHQAAPSSDTEWDARTEDALRAQDSLGVEIPIIPSKLLHRPDWPDGLQAALDAARRAWRRHGRGEMLVRVGVDQNWVDEVPLRRTLLNQLTDLPPEVGVALHVEWDASAALGNERAIDNLRIVVQALANDNRRVLMVEGGLLGWLSIAWGTWGFTAGLAQTTWLRSNEQIRRQKGQVTTRVEWYFESQLLHRLRRTMHHRLRAREDSRACACPFCTALDPGGTGAWDFGIASQHALYSIAALTDQVASPRLVDRHARVHAAVYAAQAYAETAQLRGESRPAHLQAWLSQL